SDVCSSDLCLLPQPAEPGAAQTNVGRAACQRRLMSPFGTTPVVVQNGRADMRQYMDSLLAGAPVPVHTLTTDESIAPFERSCQERAPPLIALPDRGYQGCLTQDLRVNPRRCSVLLDEYRDRLSRAELPNDPASDFLRDRVLAAVNALTPEDLDCRPINPFVPNYAQHPPSPTCPNDDPRAPLCRVSGFAWSDPNRQEMGYPPDQYRCELGEERPLPRRSAAEGIALCGASALLQCRKRVRAWKCRVSILRKQSHTARLPAFDVRGSLRSELPL